MDEVVVVVLVFVVIIGSALLAFVSSTHKPGDCASFKKPSAQRKAASSAGSERHRLEIRRHSTKLSASVRSRERVVRAGQGKLVASPRKGSPHGAGVHMVRGNCTITASS